MSLRMTTVLTEPEAAAFLAKYGIDGPREHLAATADAAVDAAHSFGYPVVLKICSPDIVRKSDVGGVRLGIADGPAVRAAVGVLVQEQRAADLELIVGARLDPTFGPVVLVGFGGIQAELLGDRVIRLAP